MSKGQQAAYDNLFPVFSLSLDDGEFSFPEIFGNRNQVLLEIGFGAGSATAEIAANNRDKNYIAVEVYKPGIGNLLKLMEKNGLTNIRIIEGDAVRVLEESIPPSSLEGVHLFFPDPWPKKRHHKRRILQPKFTAVLAAALKPGGYIYFVTDWEEYAEFALRVLNDAEELKNRYNGFAAPQQWRPVTRFQKKGEAKDHGVYELMFEKSGR